MGGICGCEEVENKRRNSHDGAHDAYGDEEAAAEDAGGEEEVGDAVDMYGAAEPKLDDFNKRDDFGNGQGVISGNTTDLYTLTSKNYYGECSDYDSIDSQSEDEVGVADGAVYGETASEGIFESKPFWKQSNKQRVKC